MTSSLDPDDTFCQIIGVVATGSRFAFFFHVCPFTNDYGLLPLSWDPKSKLKEKEKIAKKATPRYQQEHRR